MTELAKYDAAERALADADAVDEVLEIRSQAEAWRAYAKQAKNRDLEIKAARIRFRAERRLGEIILAQKQTVGLAKGGQPYQADSTGSDEVPVESRPPTLAEAGIDKKLSSKAQRVAAMDAAAFERALEQHAEEMRGGQARVAMDLHKIGAEEKGRAHRRDLAAALSDRSAELPAGRVFPAAYIDLPWKREGGIGDRAYENHYPTMSWLEILEFLRKARASLLPDSWAFFWIPRAHLLALVEIELEVTVSATGEVTLARVEVPLGWAVGHALGMDSYSTCFVWTKTDAEHPDVSGSGLIAWDQDELLLLFKRGQGLPKPSGVEKFGSNHRERAREHSRKPDFYRQMIATMVGGLPVLEMFARVDAQHPLPQGWEACGNQAAAIVVDVAEPDPPAPLSEFETLQAISRVDRRDQVAGVVADYVAKGLAIFMNPARTDWTLSEAGWKRIYQIKAEQKAAELAERDAAGDGAADLPAPQAASTPEKGIVDQPGAFAPADADAAVLPAERPGTNFVETFQALLAEDEFTQWQALARIRDGVVIDGELARGLIGTEHVAVVGDKLTLTADGAKLLRSLELFVERSERVQGRTLGIDLAPPAPQQVDLEEILATRSVVELAVATPSAPADDLLDIPLFLRRQAS